MKSKDCSFVEIGIIEKLNEARLDIEKRSNFIKQYLPFIIKTVSDVSCKYIAIGESDELSVGMMAFDEAIMRYIPEKGAFIPYAKRVMESRLITYRSKETRSTNEPIDNYVNLSYKCEHEDLGVLTEEIEIWKNELLKFKITFKKLAVERPSHKDTKERTYYLAESISKNNNFVTFMYEKFRLPITQIHNTLKVSLKILERNKCYIISLVIIFAKELGALKRWINRE